MDSGTRIIPTAASAGTTPATPTDGWGSAESAIISGGVITVESGKWYKVDTEGASSSDDLNTINGLSEGEEVMISPANASRTVVLKDGVGNLDIRVDTSLDELIDVFHFFHNGSSLIEASSRP